jgi:platelet-activating factor acetylhydrolase
LYIISDQFRKWTANYKSFPPLLAESRSSSNFAKLFYTKGSAHISQSDFQQLFPFLCRRFYGARVDSAQNLALNVRAALEFLRRLGVEGLQAQPDGILDCETEEWIELEKEGCNTVDT